jgi:MoaA/NifB/PqqE/SkfB family radical SAM enzyme
MTDRRSEVSPSFQAGFMPGKLRSVHLELTTRCNALCPMCPRTGRGVKRDSVRLVELSLGDVERILPLQTLHGLDLIDLCGGFGDPLVAAAFDGVVDYFRRENPRLALNIFTNGSLRPARWWSGLPDRIGAGGRVIFGIDGLADTHSFYRVDTDFERVLDNARSFIGAGGRAQWDFLVFRHNQHQVDAARELAREFGFEAFSPKVSGRFYKRYYEETPDLEERHGYESFPTYDRAGRPSRDLELPTDPRFRNPTLERMKREMETAGSLLPVLSAACISCRAVRERSCFVSAEGTVFPCCWTYGASKYGSVFGMSAPENLQVAGLLERHGGTEAIDAKHHPIEAIINGPFFRALERTWGARTIEDGKTKICARMCGGIFSQEDQFADPQLSPWHPGRGEAT